VTSDINRAINAAFNKKGIEIPFPQRDIHFRGPLKIERDSGLPSEVPDGGELPQS
jgi:small-conductance mechanosensitive channel